MSHKDNYYNEPDRFATLSSAGKLIPDDTNKNFATTATGSPIAPYAQGVRTGGQEIFNIQLGQWKRAKECYKEVCGEENPWKESLLNICLHLAASISALCSAVLGANEAPNLKECFGKLKDKEKWDLESEKPGLHSMIEPLNEYYNTVKHYSANKQKYFKEITKEQVTGFMRKTQEIWLWVMGRYFGGEEKIPKHLLVEFKEDFE
ncbi:MAG: hypothetical protein AB1742_05565 [bacterium]